MNTIYDRMKQVCEKPKSMYDRRLALTGIVARMGEVLGQKGYLTHENIDYILHGGEPFYIHLIERFDETCKRYTHKGQMCNHDADVVAKEYEIAKKDLTDYISNLLKGGIISG